MSESRILTVSEVVRDVKANLETLYPDVWIEGQVSNLNRHSSGHAYFSLKDAGAQISAVIFREDFARLRFQLEHGLLIVARGRITVYPPQGRFQIILSSLEPKGKGSLQLAFEQLKSRLTKEGLFDASRKRPLRELPTWIALVTSPDGAALHDMLTVLKRRAPGLRVLICPVRVQGEGAGTEIAAALQKLNEDFPTVDIILVGRGGGSLEDLWAFNEEILARAIAASRIPVVSCVGHETDFTIADFVADLRAPTPSAAAEIVSHGHQQLRQSLLQNLSRLASAIRSRLALDEQRLIRAAQHPLLQHLTAYLDEARQTLDLLLERLRLAWRHRRDRCESRLALAAQKLHLLSPLATLSRGYAIAWKLPERGVIRSAASLQPRDRIEVQVQKGRLYAEVERISDV